MIDFWLFFFPWVGLAMLQFFFLQILVQKFFWAFFFLLESRTNNGAKFNFIGIKKKKNEGVSKFFLTNKKILIII